MLNMDMEEASYSPLSPLVFLERASEVHPHRPGIIYNTRLITWSQLFHRCKQLASSLHLKGIGKGDVVGVVAPNVPAMYEVQFAVPMASAVLNCINTRLDVRTVGVLLRHSKVKAVLVDEEFLPLVTGALAYISEDQSTGFHSPLLVVVIRDEFHPTSVTSAWPPGSVEYEELLRQGDPSFAWSPPADESEVISICYTSGTTARPKGVMLTHRGTYLASVHTSLTWEMRNGAVYLWTLPLFHCNGWCFPWAVAAVSGTNICLRQVTARGIFSAIADHRVTNFCAAPTVLNTIVNAPDVQKLENSHQVNIMTAGAAPPAAVLAKIEELGFHVTHVYGLTETYGPCTVCEWKPEWSLLPPEERAKLKARQGVRYVGLEGLRVVNSETMEPVLKDGSTVGEVVMRGNMVMKGYLHDGKATAESFKGGWFHSGDLAVWHPDGYIEIKDRAKDIIISGGENISSLEVESILYRHPAVVEAAVVARPDEKWGESPCAFVALKYNCSEQEVISFCKERLPKFMVPKTVVVLPALDKTATGKIQKHVLRDRAKALGEVKHIKSKL